MKPQKRSVVGRKGPRPIFAGFEDEDYLGSLQKTAKDSWPKISNKMVMSVLQLLGTEFYRDPGWAWKQEIPPPSPSPHPRAANIEVNSIAIVVLVQWLHAGF